MADAAWWVGEIDVAVDAWDRAHRRYVKVGAFSSAAMGTAHRPEAGEPQRFEQAVGA